MPVSRFHWAYIIAGFVLLFVGGEMTVRYSVAFAALAGISTTLVGLYVVAIGTSLPELITSVIAAWRKESDLALGNILGSNVFNSLIVLPASALAGTVTIPKGSGARKSVCRSARSTPRTSSMESSSPATPPRAWISTSIELLEPKTRR